MNKKMLQKNKLKGVAAVEFGMIFPVLFIMLYGLLTYSLVFAVQHSLTAAAAEAGRAAVRFQSGNDALAQRYAAACAVAENYLDWLKGIGFRPVCTESGDSNAIALSVHVASIDCPNQVDSNIKCINTLIKFDYKNNPIIPKVMIPVPEKIIGESTTQIAMTY